MRIGLTLPNRGILFGAVTTEQMLQTAERADQSGLFNAVWVGDSLFGKPRLESIGLLAALAGRTKNVRIGPACMASFPLRDPVWLAYQWASLDVISGGRTILVACTGIVPQAGYRIEQSLFQLENKDRVGRLIEWIKILKLLWTEEHVSYEGKYYSFEDVTIEPRPVQQPRPPIWIANNAHGSRELIQRTHRRVARHADGWQTSISNPDDLAWRIADVHRQARDLGRDQHEITTHLYHNINVNEDRDAALAESKKFLDVYYTEDYSLDFVGEWVACGSPEQIIEHLRVYERIGFDEVTLRITSWNQLEQLERVINEVVPAFG